MGRQFDIGKDRICYGQGGTKLKEIRGTCEISIGCICSVKVHRIKG